ncbi:Uncharacterised protein [Vibrio cholerae]|nr:Uncharacterised protein [Vibrio cholerae]
MTGIIKPSGPTAVIQNSTLASPSRPLFKSTVNGTKPPVLSTLLMPN